MRLGVYERRRRAAAKARDHFTRAAAALTEALTAGAVAFALLEASMGLLALAEADSEDHEGESLAVRYVRQARDNGAAEKRGAT